MLKIHKWLLQTDCVVDEERKRLKYIASKIKILFQQFRRIKILRSSKM